MSKFISFLAVIAIALLIGSGHAGAENAVPAKLSAQDKADLEQVRQYFKSLKTLRGRFLQAASNGSVASGKLYLSRPGRLRFEYDPPTPILMVGDGIFLIYVDKNLKQVTHILLGSTPIGILVQDEVKLSGDITVTRVQRSPGVLRVTIKDTEEPEKGSITLAFSRAPFALRKWTVVDARNIATDVTLTGVETGVLLDKELFIFREESLKDQF
ncbi:MAG: outer membrane lipoprotein carrier protein LolA [Rhodospirillaceae bacterium]